MAQAAFAALMLVVLVALAVVYVRVGDDHSDIGGYHQDALAFFLPDGAPRHLPPEYPALALVPFGLTLIPASDYGVVFVIAMGALFVGGWMLIWRASSRSAATAYAVYLLAAGPWTLLGRFDLVPSLVVVGAILAGGRRHWRIAYALLAIGVLLKLYPVFLFPIFAIDQILPAVRGGRRVAPGGETRTYLPSRMASLAAGPAVFGAVVAAGALAAAVIDPSGWLNPIRYALQRPVQSESLPATALWLMSGFGAPGRLEHSFSSVNMIATGSSLVTAGAFAALVIGCAATWLWQYSGRLSLGRACLVCLIVVVLTSRVFSPQYLIWLLPLVALEVGLDAVWIGICVLTFIDYPLMYGLSGMMDGQTATAFTTPFLIVVAVRNGLLLLAGWRLIRGPVAHRAIAAVT
jgi:hypothetical protein